MNNITLKQKILLELVFLSVRFLNLLNINISSVILMVFTAFISITIWNYKDTSLEDMMRFTRRKPVLSLSETIPESILNKSDVKVIVTATTPPKQIFKIKETPILARSFIVYDVNDKRIISQRNSELKLPPASLVKVLSIMMFEKKFDYSSRIEIPKECTIVNGQKYGFKALEKVLVRDLIYSSLIYSAADSICALSKNSSANLNDFNNYAQKIGMVNSNFTNYIGLDFETNYTTSKDMLSMSLEFIKNTNLNSIVALKSYNMEGGRTIYNTNKMLFENQYSIGIKTGTTEGANENLIYRYQDKVNKKDFIVIILNSSNRYQDVRNLINNIYLDTE